MKNSVAIAVIAFVFASPAPAQAAPATVLLRVEGGSQTIYEGPVTTDGKDITKGGVTAPCGNSDPGNVIPTMTSALEDGSIAAGFDWDADYYGDFFVNRIGPDASDFVNDRYWGIALNLVPPPVGGCQMQVTDGDEVLFAYDFFQPDFSNKHLLKLEGPAVAETGQPVTLHVSEVACTDFSCAATTTGPAAGATVAGQTVGADGTATRVVRRRGQRAPEGREGRHDPLQRARRVRARRRRRRLREPAAQARRQGQGFLGAERLDRGHQERGEIAPRAEAAAGQGDRRRLERLEVGEAVVAPASRWALWLVERDGRALQRR